MMNPAILVFWQRYGLTAMLGLSALGFLGVIGYETRWGQALRPPLPTANVALRAPDVVATLPGFALPPLDSAFKETADRPLFTPGRRPTLNLSANVAAMKKGQFRLNGTSVNKDLAMAFLFETATGRTVRITKGKDINGMTLDVVEANRVVLKQGEETEELTLRTAASPPAPPKVAAPAPAVPGASGNVPPVASVTVGAAPPQPPSRPVPQPASPFVPAPGSSVLPGWLAPSSTSPVPAQATPAAESGDAVQRRRRIQAPLAK